MAHQDVAIQINNWELATGICCLGSLGARKDPILWKSMMIGDDVESFKKFYSNPFGFWLLSMGTFYNRIYCRQGWSYPWTTMSNHRKIGELTTPVKLFPVWRFDSLVMINQKVLVGDRNWALTLRKRSNGQVSEDMRPSICRHPDTFDECSLWLFEDSRNRTQGRNLITSVITEIESDWNCLFLP